MNKLGKREKQLRLVCDKHLRMQRHQLSKVEMARKTGQKRIYLHLLIEAVNFLSGTNSRWEVRVVDPVLVCWGWFPTPMSDSWTPAECPTV